MATTTETIKKTYPLPVYSYVVEFSDGSTPTPIGFAEISGLDIVFDTTTYKESRTEGAKAGPKVFHMPAQGTPAHLTMKKGFVATENVQHLYSWIDGIKLNQVSKKDITIRLTDETGTGVVSWKVSNAFPTRLEIPTFDATSNDVAIDTLELMADGVDIVRG